MSVFWSYSPTDCLVSLWLSLLQHPEKTVFVFCEILKGRLFPPFCLSSCCAIAVRKRGPLAVVGYKECVTVPASQSYFNWYVVNKGCGEVLGNFCDVWAKNDERDQQAQLVGRVLNLRLCNFPISRHPCEGTFKKLKREHLFFQKCLLTFTA